TGERRRAKNDISGAALTTDGRSPGCDDEYALRDPDFGGYEAPLIACGFVQGYSVANGPQVMYYSHIDYVAWLLSNASKSLPVLIRDFLTRGMAGWGAWPWYSSERRAIEEFGFEAEFFTGAFAAALDGFRTRSAFRPSSDALRDLEHRLAFS